MKKHLHRKNINSRSAFKSFTLIELLVVIAIIGILASLLLPSLSKARKKAQASVCSGQLKQLGVAMIMYTSDHDDGSFPYNKWNGNFDIITWDDLIAGYDGRDNISQAQMLLGNVDTSNEGQYQVYQCPSDDVAVNPGANSIKKSYAPPVYIEGNSSYTGIAGPSFYGAGHHSRRVNEISQASETILLSENHHMNNWMGCAFGALTPSMHDDANTNNLDTNPIPHSTKFNYLFVDGSVQRLGFYSTLYGSAFNAADTTGTMWDAGR